jgi:hypothetical protein
VEGREEEVIEEDSEKEGRLGRGEGTKVGKLRAVRRRVGVI